MVAKVCRRHYLVEQSMMLPSMLKIDSTHQDKNDEMDAVSAMPFFAFFSDVNINTLHHNFMLRI